MQIELSKFVQNSEISQCFSAREKLCLQKRSFKVLCWVKIVKPPPIDYKFLRLYCCWVAYCMLCYLLY